MFADYEMQYKHIANSAASSFSTCSSNSCSSSSDGSNWDSSSVADTPLHTPTKSAFDFIKVEDASLYTPTPSCTPERHGNEPGFCTMNSMAQDIPFGLLDMTIGFSSTEMLIPGQGMMGYDDFSTYIGPNGDAFSNHSSTSLESQSFDCNLFSPVSELGPSPAKDFVVPSQTTFMDTFDMNSPLRSTKSLQFSIQYNTPSTEYDSSFDLRSSPAESLKYFMSPNNEPRSCSTTPSRTSLPRQPAAELLQTSAALHHVQEQTHPSKRPQAERPTRRRIKQEARRSLLSSNITIQQLADNPCPWEGCNQKFQRREHLKRHLNDIHLKANCFPCIFCSHPFGRSDNLKTHLILHGDPDGDHKRTSYHPEARKVVEEMNRKSSRKRAGVKTDGVSSTKRRSRVTGS